MSRWQRVWCTHWLEEVPVWVYAFWVCKHVILVNLEYQTNVIEKYMISIVGTVIYDSCHEKIDLLGVHNWVIHDLAWCKSSQASKPEKLFSEWPRTFLLFWYQIYHSGSNRTYFTKVLRPKNCQNFEPWIFSWHASHILSLKFERVMLWYVIWSAAQAATEFFKGTLIWGTLAAASITQWLQFLFLAEPSIRGKVSKLHQEFFRLFKVECRVSS